MEETNRLQGGEAKAGAEGTFKVVPAGVIAPCEAEGLWGPAFGAKAASGGFSADFPIWTMGEEFGVHRLGRRDRSGRLVSVAAVRFTELRLSARELAPIAFIGGVATDPSWRGHGLAEALVRECIALARARSPKAKAVVLFGAASGLYERLGFRPFGRQLRVSLESLLPQLGPALPARDVGQGWVRGLRPWYLKRTNGLRIEESDFRWLAAHPHVEWRWIGDAQTVKAWCAWGRGIDLGGLVHEWGGEPTALRSLLAACVREKSGLQILAPRGGLEQFGISVENALGVEEALGLGLPLDPFLLPDPRFWIWGLDGA